MRNDKKNAIKSPWIEVSSYYVFKTLLGLIILFMFFYIYLTKYYSFEGKETLGLILVIMFIIGIGLFTNGFDEWKKIAKHEEKLEKLKRDVEIERKKRELEWFKSKDKFPIKRSRYR